MKHLKMLGLAVVAVAAVAAFAGASSAMALEANLCSATETPCSDANMYKPGQEIHAVLKAGTKATLHAGFVNIECTESTVRGKIEATYTPHGANEVLSFGGCGGATVTTPAPGELQIHHDAEHNGNLTAHGVNVKIVVIGVTCEYGGTVESGLTLLGGNPATLVAGAEITRTGGNAFLCASPAHWEAEYEVTTPKPLYVSTN